MSGNQLGKQWRGPRLPAAAGAARTRAAVAIALALAAAGLLCYGSAQAATPALAAAGHDPYGWLPRDYSSHGGAIDNLFRIIFWLTMVIFVAVEAVLVVFLIKYRHRPGQPRATFTHGNTRLEMAWTLAPAVILLALALFTKRVWDTYRFGPEGATVPRTPILVVGEQFKWNSVYPGPDGQLGNYLNYPRTSSPAYRFVSAEEAKRQIETDVRANPLGQSLDPNNPNDPGKDDDYDRLGAGRVIVVPVDTPLEVHLSSKDVLHDFFLPHFRVKLDAVPGMMGRILFTAKKQSTATLPIEQVPDDKQIWLGPQRNVTLSGLPASFKIYDPDSTASIRSGQRPIWLGQMESLRTAAQNRILRRDIAAAAKENRQPIAREAIPAAQLKAEVDALKADLKSLGFDQLTFIDEPFEVVCEELCGEGHYTMNNLFVVLGKNEYDDFINKAKRGSADPPKRLTSPAAPPQPAAQPAASAQ